MPVDLRHLARTIAPEGTRLRGWLRGADARAARLRHSLALRAPSTIRPRPRNLTVAITARCNYRCEGCRYGRDFMPGEQLSLDVVRGLLEDAAGAGTDSVRFYGGEPLLHRDLPAMIAYARELGLDPYVTTNASLLERRIDELVDAGLRFLTIGFYGVEDFYDAYAARGGAFARMERGVAAVRERHGDRVGMRLNWLLMRPTCNPRALEDVLAFARRYETPIQVDLVHYSLPYFSEGEQGRLQFTPEDRPAIQEIVDRLLEVRARDPGLIEHSEVGLRSIPDWLLQGSDMRVPCDKYDMLWVGADGTVQLCYVTFVLGNLHENRLRDMLFGQEHLRAARCALRVDCPNCHCGYDSRTRKHGPTRQRYTT